MNDGRCEVCGEVFPGEPDVFAHRDIGYCVGKLKREIERLHDDMESAWILISNAYDGDWGKASEASDWKTAVERWRDEAWHPIASQCGASEEVEVNEQ